MEKGTKYIKLMGHAYANYCSKTNLHCMLYKNAKQKPNISPIQFLAKPR